MKCNKKHERGQCSYGISIKLQVESPFSNSKQGSLLQKRQTTLSLSVPLPLPLMQSICLKDGSLPVLY